MKALLETVGALLVLCLGLGLVFGESHGELKTRMPGGQDNRMFLNVLLWDVHALSHGKTWQDVWQFPTLYPEKNMLATSEHMLGEAVLFAPLYAATGEPVLAFNLLLLLMCVLNFLAAYFVARRLLSAPAPALLSAVLFTFGSYRLYQILHLQLWVHFPTPLLFLACVRLVERGGWRWPVLGGVCLACQFYLSMSLGYFALIMIGLMLVTLAFHAPSSFGERRFLSQVSLAGLVAGLLMLPLARPYSEAAHHWGTWTWNAPMSFLPSWHNFFSPAPEGTTPADLAMFAERALYWGYVPWMLLAVAVGTLIWQTAKRPECLRFWAIASAVLVGALACIAVNHFQSYRLLFEVVPGFKGLRVPGRLALLALWPCGLLAGWGLDRLGATLFPRTPGRRAAFGFVIALLAFQENYHRLDVLKQYWTDFRITPPAFYHDVVAKLPPGAVATIPLVRVGDAFPVAGAMAADFRPTLNVYTSRGPIWWWTVATRSDHLENSRQAASLMGEFRLRGFRYLIFDKSILRPGRGDLWAKACTLDGKPWGRVIYDDAGFRIIDLEATLPELVLLPEWAGIVSTEDQSLKVKIDDAGSVPAGRVIAFEPSMPLQPGRYEALFDIEGVPASEGSCEVTRMFLEPRKDWRLDPDHPPVALVKAPFQLSLDHETVRLEFTVPDQAVGEPVLQFRVSHAGGGSVAVRRVRIRPQ
jgi:hypothetical protein